MEAVAQLLGSAPSAPDSAGVDGPALRFCNHANATICEPSVRSSRKGRNIRVVVYNPLAWRVRTPLRVAVSTSASCNWLVQGWQSRRVVVFRERHITDLEYAFACDEWGRSVTSVRTTLQPSTVQWSPGMEWVIRSLVPYALTHNTVPCAGPNNETLPSQTVPADAATLRLQRAIRETNASMEAAGDAEVAWVADLQPLGLATYTLLPASGPASDTAEALDAASRRRPTEALDNGVLRLEFDTESGGWKVARGAKDSAWSFAKCGPPDMRDAAPQGCTGLAKAHMRRV